MMTVRPDFKMFLAISALAGSGKTYKLSSRYIALLAMGADPSSILAITFTRKAAGEIFDRIIQRLAKAARDEGELEKLRQSLSKEWGDAPVPISAANAREWLRALLAAMPKLRISTIDSLFASILKAYAVEFGLPSPQRMLEGARLDRAREEALAQAFMWISKDPHARPSFLEAFKRASAGEAKSARAVILDVIATGHETYRDQRDAGAWGDFARIWPRPPWWAPSLRIGEADIDACVNALEECFVGSAGYAKDLQNAWATLLGHVRMGDWDAALETTLFGRIIENLPGATSSMSFVFGRSKKECVVSGDTLAHVRTLVQAVLGKVVHRLLDETQGMHAILQAYDVGYEDEVLRQGRMAFSDMTRMLGPNYLPEHLKLEMNYRLDGQINHWLLDEFQDTSKLQWSVMEPLAAEVLQSPADRSFFYVGDAKQAIYGWRGGEANLFEQVQKAYSSRFPQEDALDVSWRSSPTVLKAVNQTFSQLTSAACLTKSYSDAAHAWDQRWREHKTADLNRELPGRVELYEIRKKERGEEGDPVCMEQSCRIIERLHAQRVRSIGALVRNNKYGDRLADALRKRGLPVRRESAPNLMDNGVVSAFLSMLKLADHPADAFAEPHLRATPLWDALARWMNGVGEPPAEKNHREMVIRWASRWREIAAHEGVAGLLRHALDACRGDAALEDEFIRMRVTQLLDAAIEFDRNDRGSPSEFARLAELLEAHEPGVEGGIVVTTIHKAKGLEYDAVVLSELQGPEKNLDFIRSGSLRIGGTEAQPWVLPWPKSALVEKDPGLGQFAKDAQNQKVEEELCLLYVAMTRARQGLYLVTEQAGKSSDAIYAATLLHEKLSNMETDFQNEDGLEVRLRYAEGDPEWPKKSAPKATEPGSAIVPVPFAAPQPAAATGVSRRLAYRTPSGEEKPSAEPVAHLQFGRGKSLAAGRGNVLHDLFSRIEWYSESAGADALKSYENEHGACPPEIRAEFLRALAAPEIIEAMRRPDRRAETWREQAFEWSDTREWVSGRMDRVVIVRDAGGRPVSARVLDFKSDRIPAGQSPAKLLDSYAPQIALYRKVLSRLTGLPASAIGAALILTQFAQVLDVP